MKFSRIFQIGCKSVLLYPFRLLLVAVLMTISLGLLGGSITAALFDPFQAKCQALFLHEEVYTVYSNSSEELEKLIRESPRPYARAVYANVLPDFVKFRGPSDEFAVSENVLFSEPKHLVYADSDYFRTRNMQICGRLPQAENEIALSVCTYRMFHECGYYDEIACPMEFVDGKAVIDFSYLKKVPTMEAMTDGSIRLYLSFPEQASPQQVTVVGIVDYGECTNHDDGVMNDRDAIYVCKSYFDQFKKRNDQYLIETKGEAFENDLSLLRAVENGEFLRLTSSLANEIDEASSVLGRAKQIMLYVGIALSLVSAALIWQFTSLMLENKKGEIGILRSLGAGKTEIHLIFHTANLTFAALYVVTGIALSAILIPVINQSVLNNFGVPLAFMSFTPWACLAIVAIGFGVTFLSAFFPILRTVRRTPVEIIKTFET